MGVNLCPYPSFEDGETGWTGWHDYPGSDLFPVSSLTSPVETEVTTGARFEAHQTGVGQHGTLMSDFIPVTPGEDYILSFYFLGVEVGGELFAVDDGVELVLYDAAKNSISSGGAGAYAVPTTSWQRFVSGTITIQEGIGIAYAKVGVQYALQTGNTIEFTSFKFELAPLTDYNDNDPIWKNCSLVINDDDASTDDNDVVLTIHAEDADGDPPDEMRLAEAPVGTDPGDVVWGAWEPYATTRAWQLAAQTDEAAHDIGVGVEFQRT